MHTTSLSDIELETVVIALKYWRIHRHDGDVRKSDRMLKITELDSLLEKLGAGQAMMETESDVIRSLLAR
jgi:hypothetical protein